jgi:hypothetical protein
MIRLGSNRTATVAAVKTMALIAAALVLGAQLLAIAHFHQADPTRRLNSRPAVVADDGLCALCILAFHMPLNPPALPAVERPEASAPPLVLPPAHALSSHSRSVWLTRAPPMLAA